jgi:hypothetical protein
MTAASHTSYTLALFLALIVLKLWSERRHRVSEAFRASVARTLSSS